MMHSMQSITAEKSTLSASPTLGRVVMMSLSVLMLGIAIAWMGFFLTQ